MTTIKKITDKNTKQEIWQAYDELLNSMNTLPIQFTPTKKEDGKESFVKNITELKLTISDNLDRIANDLIKSQNDAEAFRISLESERAQIGAEIRTKKEALEMEMDKVKKDHFEQDQDRQRTQELVMKERETERQREDDEYKYNLSIKRRQENETYEAQKTIEITKIKEREDSVADREKEIAEMGKTILQMPTQIEDAVSLAETKLGKELTTKFTSEITSLKIEAEHQKKIYELYSKNYEATVNTQKHELDSLQKQLIDANRQLKEIAVAVIEGGGNKDGVATSTSQSN